MDDICLKVYNKTVVNSTLLYNTCTSGASGTISYKIEGDGTYLAKAIITLKDAYGGLVETADLNIQLGEPDGYLVNSTYGFTIGLIVILTLGMLGFASGNVPAGFILIGIGMFLVDKIKWIQFNSYVLYPIIMVLLVLAIVSKRE